MYIYIIRKCIYVCICIHEFIYMNINIYIGSWGETHSRVMYVYMYYICIHVFIHIYICSYIYEYMYI